MNIYDEGYQKEATIIVNGREFIVQRLDVHHFNMKIKGSTSNGAIWHIAQVADDMPYKNDIAVWLKDDDYDINLKEYHYN